MSKRKAEIILFLIFIFVGMFTGCEKKEQARQRLPIAVSVVRAEKETLFDTIHFVGDVKAIDEAEVFPRASGKVKEKLKQDGDLVKKYDILAYVDRDEVGFEFEKLPVESPIDGVVGRVYVDKGMSVSPQTPIALVVNMDTVKVKINVIEKDLPKIAVGQIAKIQADAYPDEVFQGAVERISPVVDLDSRTATAEIMILNTDFRLKPGMFARIKVLVDKREDVLVIPRDAMIRENSSYYVFVVGPDNKVLRQKIETGLNENNKFEVISGLSEGELVVTMGNTLLKPGDIVKAVIEPDIQEQEQ
jgi:membrane fusion protein (multidrug efflux system)